MAFEETLHFIACVIVIPRFLHASRQPAETRQKIFTGTRCEQIVFQPVAEALCRLRQVLKMVKDAGGDDNVARLNPGIIHVVNVGVDQAHICKSVMPDHTLRLKAAISFPEPNRMYWPKQAGIRRRRIQSRWRPGAARVRFPGCIDGSPLPNRTASERRPESAIRRSVCGSKRVRVKSQVTKPAGMAVRKDHNRGGKSDWMDGFFERPGPELWQAVRTASERN